MMFRNAFPTVPKDEGTGSPQNAGNTDTTL